MGEYYIVYERGSTIRSLARQSLRGQWLGAIIVMLMNYIISNLPYLLVSSLTKSEFLLTAAAVYSYMVAGPLSLGMAFFFLKLFRMQEHNPRMLLDGFKYFRNALGVYVMTLMRIFLWSLLFIIPGIIASFRFSQAFFILADDPEIDVINNWKEYFSEKPQPFTKEEKKAYLASLSGTSLASDGFFPFRDNIDRAAKSAVSYVAEPGGSSRDEDIIKAADEHGMVLVFTHVRLFHH